MQVSKSSELLGRIFYPLSRIQMFTAMALMIAAMLLTTTDVILRALFNRPIMGILELIEFMLAIIIFFILAETMVRGRHISTEIVISRLSPKHRELVMAVSHFIGLGLWSLITWQLVVQGRNLWLAGQESESLHIPVYIFMLLTAFGSAVFSGVILKYFVASLAQLGKTWSNGLWILSVVILVLLLFTAAIWTGWLSLGLSPLIIGVIGIIALLALLASGMPIIFVFGIIGFWGFGYLTSTTGALGHLGTSLYRTASHYDYIVIPLFMIMGSFCFYANLSRDLYDSAHKWLGHFPGGLAMATVAGCAGFAAVTGSSAACAMTIGSVALPEMKRYKYDGALATGCVAAGGTIGVLIPPSVSFVIYGILTEQSIGKLFLAGFIPGILQAIFYITTIYVTCRLNPSLGPIGGSTSFLEKVSSLKNTWAVLILFLLVIGGLYAGIFTATEAAAIGAFAALLFALGTRRLSWHNFKSSLVDTAMNTGLIGILLTAAVFGYFLAVTRLPFELSDLVTTLAVPRLLILIIILIIYLVLGCFMPSIPMVVLTVPIFYPLVMALGYNPIWFGVLIVRMMEIGMITPPVGMNVFLIYGVAKDIPMYTIFRGIIPFLIADVFHLALLIALPEISLFLPNLMT